MVKTEQPRPWRFYFSGIASEHSCGTHTYWDPENQWHHLPENERPAKEATA